MFATDMARAASARSGERLTNEDLKGWGSADQIRLFPARPPYRLAFSPRLASALRGYPPPDLVRIHSLFLFPQYAAWRYCRRTATPYMVSIHGALDPYLRRRGRLRKQFASLMWQDEMLRCASAVHVTTSAEAAAVGEVLPDLPLVTVPNGIQAGHFREASEGSHFRARFLKGHRGPVVLFLGRINFKKGLDLLVDAFAKVLHEVPDARLAIVGPDDEGLQPSLEQLAMGHHIAEHVTFTGPLYGQERLDALGAATAWVLPSHTENFGIAVIEAMAAGIPVIVSPQVNLASEIEDAGAGLVVPRELGNLQDQLIRLLRDERLRASLVNRGHELVRRYDWSVVGPQLAEACRLTASRGSRYAGRARVVRRRSKKSA